MAASLRPTKGILKNKSSKTSSLAVSNELQPELGDERRKKSQRWDEVSIQATYHPADKDYGLVEIGEASTPYHRTVGDDEDAMRDSEAAQALTRDTLANKSAAAEGLESKYQDREQESGDKDCAFSPQKQGKKSLLSACCLLFCKCSEGKAQGEERTQLQETSTPAIEKKRQFEMKRKLHSNEGLNIKLGRELSSKNLDNDDEGDEEMPETAAGESMDMKESNQGSTRGDQVQTKSQSS